MMRPEPRDPGLRSTGAGRVGNIILICSAVVYLLLLLVLAVNVDWSHW